MFKHVNVFLSACIFNELPYFTHHWHLKFSCHLEISLIMESEQNKRENSDMIEFEDLGA